MLIFSKRNERIERYNAQMQSSDHAAVPYNQPERRQRVDSIELFKIMGIGSA
jgi:hypothetical protein